MSLLYSRFRAKEPYSPHEPCMGIQTNVEVEGRVRIGDPVYVIYKWNNNKLCHIYTWKPGYVIYKWKRKTTTISYAIYIRENQAMSSIREQQSMLYTHENQTTSAIRGNQTMPYIRGNQSMSYIRGNHSNIILHTYIVI